jgi:hypothetical protein
METIRIRLQLALLIIQVLAIVFGGMAMFVEVRGVVADVRELKTDVRELRDGNAALLVIVRDVEDLRERVRRLEGRD